MADGAARAIVEAMSGWAYAHRGLHDADVPENSLAAFDAAIATGLGIECDIRKSSDGRAIVFHDAALSRLAGRGDSLGALPVGDLTGITLGASAERIPTLRDTLDRVAGQVPLLLEVKMDDGRPVDPICRAVRRDLDGYDGLFAVMSFDPRVSAWFAEREPGMARGLVITEQNSRTLAAAFRRRAAIRRARPHLLALDIRDLPSRLARRERRRDRPLFTWTVKGSEQVQTAFEAGASPILEGPGVAAWRSST